MAVSGVITNVVTGLGNLKTIVGNVLGWIGAHMTQAVDGWKHVMSGFGQFVAGIWNGVSGAIATVLNWIITQINNNVISAIDRININTPFGHIGFNFPLLALITTGSTGVGSSIPSFASGVTDFSGGLAYVHQDELLANLSPGTSVFNRTQTQGLLAGSGSRGGSGAIVYNYSPVINISMSGRPSRADLEGMAEDLNRILAKKMRGNANIPTATSGSVRS